MKFNFKFGKPKTSQIIITSTVLSFLVSGLHSCTQIKETRIWEFIDDFQRHFQIEGVSPIINDIIINDPKLIESRVKNEVNEAIKEYQKEVNKIEPPSSIIKDAIYYQCNPDTSEAQILLGGPIGIHSPWYTTKDCK